MVPVDWQYGVVVQALGRSPRQRILDECERRGSDAVVRGCVDLLNGRVVDDEFIVALGGAPAVHVLAGFEGGRKGYWPRVWAARGLLHVWAVSATPDIIRATSDSSWRVREMAAKVVARHTVDDALDAVVALRQDGVPRVRTAAERAVIGLANADH